jgi:hypothetical protein
MDRAREVIGSDMFVYIDPESLSARDDEAASHISRLLEGEGIILPDERGVSGDGI